MKIKAKPRGKAKRVAAVKAKARAKSKARRAPAQRFTVSHLREEDFKVDGLRPYAAYRDLGVAAASNGLVAAHVIRHAPGTRPEDRVSPRHYHDVKFQMVYVLKGWIRSEIEGVGQNTFTAGSCWMQPARIKHKVLATSEDMELLEVLMPAEFDTVNVE